jgi:hypothetical protein
MLQELQRLGTLLGRQSSRDDVIAAWRSVCALPQDCRVFGIPFRTHAAKIMLDADYLTKRFVDTEAPDVEHFTSLLDMHLDETKAALRTGGQRTAPRTMMNRFYYHPDALRLKADGHACLVDHFALKLLTEEQHVTRQGQAVDRGAPDPLAERWARQFMAVYDRVAEQHPVFRELEGFARTVALTRALQFDDGPARAGLDLGWLLDRFAVPEVEVPTTLPGRCNVKTFEHTDAIPGGFRRHHVLMPSCGGVDLAVRVDRETFGPDRDGLARTVGRVATRRRPNGSALYWDV